MTFSVPILLWAITIFYAMMESGVKLVGHCRLTTIGAMIGTGPKCAGEDVLTASGAAAGGVAANIVAYARAQLGKPYAWGQPSTCSGSPAAFDCSGLSKCAVKAATGGRLELAHFTVLQQAQLSKVSVPKTPSAWQPGDLIFYFIPTDAPTEPGHVAIYIGGGRVIHAPHPGTVVTEGDWNMGPGTYITAVRRPAAMPGVSAPTGGGRPAPTSQATGLPPTHSGLPGYPRAA